MEKSKSLYRAFTRLAIKLAILKGKTLEEAKALILGLFENHPFEKVIIKSIKNDEFDKKTLNQLSEECLRICRDFGPDRDYVTLVLMLKKINRVRVKGVPSDKSTSAFLKHFKKEIQTINKNIDAPPMYNVLLETRSVIEWSTMFGIYHIIPKQKKGKNKPVLLMPPYLGNDYSTRFVRKYLKSVGFKTYKWELGVNTINSKYIPKLVEKLDEIYEKHQEKVSLVGWSGGGIFAKIIANRYPDKVEQLITIGSPVWGVKNMKTPLVKTLEFFRGKSLKERNNQILEELEEIPNVPITCIYTRTDGLVPWKNCLEAETYRSDIKNVEVFGSHCGLGANASVLVTVANTLIENTQGEAPNGLVTQIESFFFPKFWQQKKSDIIKGLMLKT
ncbi:MAG: alpha/beta hydrolase [Winogradskyella sp.]|uniref:alpha/beta fold hydrolase n=1 Tax=Winogradskyella sp. TaxID=1883156 RepID=UPI000F4068EE|nr:alpha/beta hydrolase [Winogradskyella sp.]RNC84149.1 MAG: alpha/beta hydrolase [Winogradskyella sp.]